MVQGSRLMVQAQVVELREPELRNQGMVDLREAVSSL